MSPYLQESPVRPRPAASGLRLVDRKGRELPLTGVHVQAQAKSGLARVSLQSTFRNDFAEPLEVLYQLPLPADAAVAGFSFRIGDREVKGRVKSREEARRSYQDALLEGRSAALLEQDRSSLFQQQVGNVPPGATITVCTELDQPLHWHAAQTSEWEWRFPTVVAPRYLGEPERVEDAEHVQVEANRKAPAVQVSLKLEVEDELQVFCHSPSHALRTEGNQVQLAEQASLDRDLVVRWSVARPEPGVSLSVHRPEQGHAFQDSAFAQLTIVPPTGAQADLRRELVVLLDTSGSMGGAPLTQAQTVVDALLQSLADGDRLELIEFSNAPRRWRKGSTVVNAATRSEARAWVQALQASGGTEMRSGILAALKSAPKESQRQILLVTDGLIGFEDEIVEAIRTRLPRASRVHTLGVGHGVNRSLTEAAARAGRGQERIVAPGEPVDQARDELLAFTAAPQLVDLDVSGSALRKLASAPRDLFAGAPTRLPLELDPAGGTLVLQARAATGLWRTEVTVPACAAGQGNPACATTFARECVAELESAGAASMDPVELDSEIERLGIEFQIATQRTSWVAVSEQADVDPRLSTRRLRMPHAMPAGMSAPMAAPMASGVVPEAMEALSFADEEDAEGVAKQEVPRRIARRRSILPEFPTKKGKGKERSRGLLGRLRPVPGPISLKGRIVAFDEGRVVIEVELARDLKWQLPRGVSFLFYREGEPQVTQDFAIDTSISTGAGQLKEGQILRLVVQMSPNAEALGAEDLLTARIQYPAPIAIQLQ